MTRLTLRIPLTVVINTVCMHLLPLLFSCVTKNTLFALSSTHNLRQAIPRYDMIYLTIPHVWNMDARQFSCKHHEVFARAAMLNVCDGLVSTTAVMISVGGFQQDIIINIIQLGLSWMMARNCSMFVSAMSQHDRKVETENALHAAAMVANEGMLTIAFLMLSVGAVNESHKAMMLSGFAGFVANACSKVTWEFASLYSPWKIEVPPMKRDTDDKGQSREREDGDTTEKKESSQNPLQIVAALALAFSVGAIVPLLTAFSIREYDVWLRIVVATVSIALVLFGLLWAVLVMAPKLMSAMIFLVVGWMLVAITFALTKLIGSSRFITSLET